VILQQQTADVNMIVDADAETYQTMAAAFSIPTADAATLSCCLFSSPAVAADGVMEIMAAWAETTTAAG